MRSAMILGIDSGIGSYLATRLEEDGWNLFATTRRQGGLKSEKILRCDFGSSNSIDQCIAEISKMGVKFELIIIAVGTMNPIGKFEDVDADEWENGFYTNFFGPLRFLRGIRNRLDLESTPLILTFAGGGINSAPTNYTAYTLSKVILTKSIELLASEWSNVKLISLGTGWIDTKIHTQTLAAKMSAGENYDKTLLRINQGNFVPIERIYQFLIWAIQQDSEAVSGRNFSLVDDPWNDNSNSLITSLKQNPHKFKLRRSNG